MGIYSTIAFSCNSTSHYIGNPQNFSTPCLSLTKSSKGICGFTGLTYYNNQIIFRKNRIAIPELWSVFNLNRNPCIFFKQVFTDESCMPWCSTCDKNYPLYRIELFISHIETAEMYPAFTGNYSSPESIGYSIRLFKDLFLHEIIIALFLNWFYVPVNTDSFLFNSWFVKTVCSETALFHLCDFIIFKVYNVFSVFNDCTCVWSNYHLIITDSHDER